MVTPTFSVGVLVWYFRVFLGPRGIDKQQSRFVYACENYLLVMEKTS